MAGAGKKTFVAGEVLTAAQVNDYLMDQAVMRFSGSAARAASITAPTEGMITYLDDVNRVEYYSGSAWVAVSPTDVLQRSNFTAKGQILVASANAAPIAISIGAEGQVLTAASAQTSGVSWQTPAGAGKAVYKNIAATGVTGLPGSLTAGFYRISTGNTTSWTDTQFRFVDGFGNLYGATITSGTGFMTIPTTVASVNITTSAGFNLLVEEIPGVTSILPTGPTVTGFGWQNLTNASVAFTSGITPSRVGYFNTITGAFVSSTLVTSPFSGATFASSVTTALGADVRFNFLQQNSDGLWSTNASSWSSSAFSAFYPYQVFTANGTYTPPSWSASADVFILSGGGAGGGNPNLATTGAYTGGGGGAGGASLFTNVATPASVSVTVGAGGTGGTAAGPNGSNSSFGARSTSGGGGGGSAGNGATGGSGGGGGGRLNSPTTVNGTGGSGTAGQGNAGGNANVPGGTPSNGGGGGGTGGAGGNATTTNSGAGGTGSTYLTVPYGGGGSGGGTDTIPAGTSGGGTGGQAIAFGPVSQQNGSPGTANTGGGGGGAAVWDGTAPLASPTATTAGSGGSGLVIVRAL